MRYPIFSEPLGKCQQPCLTATQELRLRPVDGSFMRLASGRQGGGTPQHILTIDSIDDIYIYLPLIN